MSRRGFALVTVLWVLAALSAVVGSALALARTGIAASGNRIVLTRGAWAREACVEILLARYVRDPALRLVDTVDLGRGTWCRARLENTASRLDLNLASPDALRIIIANDTLADALLDWRDPDDVVRPHGAEASWYHERRLPLPRNSQLADPAELRQVRGFDSSLVVRLSSLLTTDGTGQLDLNAAPAELLVALPGLGAEAIALIMHRRSLGGPIAGAEQLLSLLSPSARTALLRQYQEFSRQAVYAPPGWVATVEGGVRGAVPVSRAVLTVVPAAERLALVRRRSE